MLERFEKREYAVNGAAVVLYLRALLATNAIAEYLPDENKSRASGLPRLVRIDIHRSGLCLVCFTEMAALTSKPSNERLGTDQIIHKLW